MIKIVLKFDFVGMNLVDFKLLVVFIIGLIVVLKEIVFCFFLFLKFVKISDIRFFVLEFFIMK